MGHGRVAPLIFKKFINGEWVEARERERVRNRNPAEHRFELMGMFVSSRRKDVDAAVDGPKED